MKIQDLLQQNSILADLTGTTKNDILTAMATFMASRYGLPDGEDVGQALRLRRLDQSHVHPRLARQKERKSEKLASDRQST